MHLNRKKVKPKLKLSVKGKVSSSVKSSPKRHIKKQREEIDIPLSTRKIRSKLKTKKKIVNSRRHTFSDYTKIAKEYEKYRAVRKCKNILYGNPAFLLGNGPSIKKRDLSLLDDFFTIGMNRIFFIYEPTILFWQDRELWRSNEKEVVRSKALKICRNIGDPRNLFIHFRLGQDPFRFSGKPHKLYGRGNTGVLSAQFAHGLGCSSLVLLGMDCKYAENGDTDFYGKNEHHKHYTLKMCNTTIKWLKKNSPVPIYNCSDNKQWPQRELQDVIEEIKPEPYGKKYFRNLFLK